MKTKLVKKPKRKASTRQASRKDLRELINPLVPQPAVIDKSETLSPILKTIRKTALIFQKVTNFDILT
jgi:hypothetical protein